MTEEQKPEVVEFKTLDEAMGAISDLDKAAGTEVRKYHQWVEQLTGHPTGKPVSAMDVVNIVRKVFRL